MKSLCQKNKINFYKRSKRDSIPFTSVSYRPELERTEYCSEDRITIYQNIIGMLRWTCKLGRIDILHETSLLSQYLAKPREGHLRQAVSIFEYLEKFARSWTVMDHDSYEVQWHPFKNEISPEERANIMKQIYPDAIESFPHNVPVPRGKSVDINVFVDADHAGNRVTRRSHTGILIYINCAPIIWFSKRQNTVETSTFSSEIIALKIAVELVEGLRYKLRALGVELKGPARIFCDNEAVVKCTSFPESALKRKHCSVAYAKVRCAIAAGIVLLYYVESKMNLADLLTKVLPYSRRTEIIRSILD